MGHVKFATKKSETTVFLPFNGYTDRLGKFKDKATQEKRVYFE